MPLTRRWFLQALGVVSAATVATRGGVVVPEPAEEPVVPVPASPCTDALLLRNTPTMLELFLRSRGIKPAHLARESGYTRAHLLRVRMGRIEPDPRCMAAVANAVRRLSREHVRASDLFGAAAITACIDRGPMW